MNKYPFYVHLLMMPFTWTYAILKLLSTLPIVIVAKCNDALANIK